MHNIENETNTLSNLLRKKQQAWIILALSRSLKIYTSFRAHSSATNPTLLPKDNCCNLFSFIREHGSAEYTKTGKKIIKNILETYLTIIGPLSIKGSPYTEKQIR